MKQIACTMLLATLLCACGAAAGEDEPPSPYVIQNFPFTFLPEGGGELIVKKAATTKPPRVPFRMDNRWYWEAWVCENPKCPGRQDGKPFAYPNVILYIKKLIDQGKYDPTKPLPMPTADDAKASPMRMPFMNECPQCTEAKIPGFQVRRYQTPEGQMLLEDLRKRVQAEVKRSEAIRQTQAKQDEPPPATGSEGLAAATTIKADEIEAIRALKCFAGAQGIYKRANYASMNGLPAKQFAPSFSFLSSHTNVNGVAIHLIPPLMAEAVGPEKGFFGYYFVDAKMPDPMSQFGLFAAPCQYGKTGIHAFFADETGMVRQKDLAGKAPDPAKPIDETWTEAPDIE
ncbi:secreted protein [sediment metagenome]|uniref:Secreted protein n=1 Tax=sediment metagenome TaxID=749907 RepID=D9PKA8_9ZZZZ